MCSKLWLATLVAPLNGGFQHGYNLGIFNLIEDWLMDDWYRDVDDKRDKEMEEKTVYILGPVTMATLSIGAIAGSLLMGVLAEFKGRKICVLSCFGFMVIGLIMMCFSQLAYAYELLIVGRFFMGLCIGMSSGIVPVYLFEIAPEDYRGLVGSMYGVTISFGVYFSILMTFNETFGNEKYWTVAIAISCIPSAIHIIFFSICPESPKYLIFTDDDEDEAEEALLWLRTDWDIDEEMDELQEELHVLEEIGHVSVEKMFNDQTIRSPLIICTVIILGHHFCGANTAFSYSYKVFRDLGFSEEAAKYCVMSIATEYFIISVISALMVECVGRKLLLLLSFGGMSMSTFCLFLVSILARTNHHLVNNINYVIVVFHFLLVLSFAFGAGTIPWFITSEMHNYGARTLATSFVMTLGWIANFIYYISFVPMLGRIGGVHYLFFFLANLSTLIFLGITMRETMDLTAVEIIELFY